MADDDGTDRTSVKTYVPKYQKREWTEHADELGVSQSEFVRLMVQAGRRGFEIRPRNSADEEGPSDTSTPRGNVVESRILATLQRKGAMSWDELLEAISTDFEDRLEEALEELQDENEVRYSGRQGGYVATNVE